MTSPDTQSYLVEHRYTGRLVCHVTGFSMPRPKFCPECKAEDSLTSVGPGVERVAEEAKHLFPDARIEIYSSDSASGADLVDRMERGEIDILVGTQIAARVDAPPNLAELARIEQQRDTSAMFPLMLTDSGLIMGSPGADLRDADLAAALRAAEALIAQQPAPADARARNLQYLALLHRAGAGAFDTLPADLLFPVNTPVERAETITLPDGLTGSYALAYHARTQSDAPWLDQAERRVMTRIDGLERRSTERWRLTLL